MRFTTLGRFFALLTMAAMFVSGVALAQSNTQGAISGTITDSSNAVLPNVTVLLKSLDKGFVTSTTTSSSGGYSFPLIDPGAYSVTVNASGFKQFTAKTTVQVGQSSTVNVKLEVGATGTTVEVSGEAPLEIGR